MRGLKIILNRIYNMYLAAIGQIPCDIHYGVSDNENHTT